MIQVQEALSYDQEMERNVLGACLLEPSSVVEALSLEEEDFGDLNHRLLWRAIRSLDQKRAPISISTVGVEMRSQGNFEKVGEISFLEQVMHFVPSALGIRYHVGILKRLSARHRAVLQAQTMALRLSKTHIDEFDDVFSQSMAALQGTAPPSQGVVTLKAATEESMAELDEQAQGKKKAAVSTGIWTLDEITGGLHAGELTVVGARPSCGKSSLLTTMALAAASRGNRVLYHSLEVRRQDLSINMAAATARIDSTLIRRGRCSAEQRDLLYKAQSRISELPIKVDDGVRRPVSQMRANVHRDGPFDVLFVDYLQLVQPTPAQTREREVAMMSCELKQIARDFDIPVVVACQLNRESENRADPKPRLSDFRESGSIEQDADQALLLHLDKRSGESVSSVLLRVAKNRNGPIADIDVKFWKAFSLMSAIDGPSPSFWRNQ